MVLRDHAVTQCLRSYRAAMVFSGAVVPPGQAAGHEV